MITLSSIITGAIIGWIANSIMKNKGGFFRNVVTGMIGSFVGSQVFRFIGFTAHGFIANSFVGVVGACIFIAIGRKLFK